MKTRNTLLNIFSFLFIAMFLYAATSKLSRFNLYVIQMKKQPFPESFVPFLVWGVPTLEIIASILLIIPLTRKKGFLLSTILMILFTGYIILIMLHIFGKIPCTCGGVIAEFSWPQHLLFNIFFVLIGSTALFIDRKTNDNLNLAQ